MTIDALIEELEGLRDSVGGEGEVKVALQPDWPLAARIDAVTRIGETVWLATGAATEYAPKRAWEGGAFDSDEDDEEDED